MRGTARVLSTVLLSAVTVAGLAAVARAGTEAGLTARVGTPGAAVPKRQSPVSPSAPGASPEEPRALVVAPDGALIVVDPGRDQVLRRLADGRFAVVAGDGRRGSSGDGGPATRAELRLAGNSGIAIAPDGTIYFSDTGNGRVRAVLPDGDIETAAGGGHDPLPTSPRGRVPALSASLGGPAGLAFGPDKDLYIAATFIVRLTSMGTLVWVAGSEQANGTICYTRGCPVREFNLVGADGLAFDGKGDLFVSSSNLPGAGFALAEVRADGRAVYIGGMRGEGGMPAAIAPGPHGSVICAAQVGLYRIANGGDTPSLVPGQASLKVGPWPFFGGDGIAAGPNGVIYADTSPLANPTPNAIVELYSSGASRTLWES